MCGVGFRVIFGVKQGRGGRGKREGTRMINSGTPFFTARLSAELSQSFYEVVVLETF